MVAEFVQKHAAGQILSPGQEEKTPKRRRAGRKELQ